MLDLAIQNSVRWCTTVLDAHRSASECTEHVWSTDAAPPPYYGNLITRTRDGSDAQLARIRVLAKRRPRPEWGLKDSFDSLPADVLRDLGLRDLFAARWFGLRGGVRAGDVDAGGANAELAFAPVETRHGLSEWEREWKRSSPSPGLRVFPNVLLDDPDVTFLTAQRDGELVGGAIANRSDGAVGLSNVFAFAGQSLDEVRCGAAIRVRAAYPNRAVVGYGTDIAMSSLAGLGFEDLGPLRVWVASA